METWSGNIDETLVMIADCETTGLENPIGVVEIAWMLCDWDLNVLSKFDIITNPGMPIPADVTALHGITDEMAARAPVMHNLLWPEVPVVLVCHNIKYDRPLLEPHLNIVSDFCTYITSRRLLPDAPNHKLDTLAAYCELPPTIPHRAPSDVFDVYGLLRYLLEGLPGWNFKKLYEFYHTPYVYSVMPLGKHKGKHGSDVPMGYWHWLLGEDFDRDMKMTAKYWQEQRRKKK